MGSHRRQVEGGPSATDVPAGLDPARLRKGALRLVAFAAFVVALHTIHGWDTEEPMGALADAG